MTIQQVINTILVVGAAFVASVLVWLSAKKNWEGRDIVNKHEEEVD